MLLKSSTPKKRKSILGPMQNNSPRSVEVSEAQTRLVFVHYQGCSGIAQTLFRIRFHRRKASMEDWPSVRPGLVMSKPNRSWC